MKLNFDGSGPAAEVLRSVLEKREREQQEKKALLVANHIDECQQKCDRVMARIRALRKQARILADELKFAKVENIAPESFVKKWNASVPLVEFAGRVSPAPEFEVD